MAPRPTKKMGRKIGRPNVNYLRIPAGISRRKTLKVVCLDAKSQLKRSLTEDVLLALPTRK